MKSRQLLPITLLTLIWSAIALPLSAQPETPVADAPDRLTPDKAIQRDMQGFLLGLNLDTPYTEAGPYVVGYRMGFYGGDLWAKQWGSDRGKSRLLFDSVQINKLETDRAEITLFYHWRAQLFSSPVLQENFELKRQKNLNMPQEQRWCIVPDKVTTDLKGSKSLHSVVRALVVPTLPLSEARALKSQSNLKQLSLGIMQFLQDYDEVFAFYPEYIQDALTPYTVGTSSPDREEKIRDLFTIPGLRDQYAFNEKLSDININRLKDPAQTVLLYEGADETPVFRYDGKAAIAFADGHVALVTKEDAAKLIWKP